MDEEPTIAELMLSLSDAHEVRAVAQDSEFDRGAADAFERAAHIIEGEESDEPIEIREEYTELLGGHASAGGELDG